MGTQVDKYNDSNLESIVLQNSTPALAMFYATWNGASRGMAITFRQAALRYSADVSFVMLDIEESPQMAQRFEVTNVPTVCLFKNGKVVATLGLADEAQLTAFIDGNI